jgi:hypothetical protein
VHHGERAETEEVDLEEAQRLDVVFVPLDHGAVGHGAVLDGHDAVNRLVAEEEAARVDGEVARKVLDLEHQLDQVVVHRRAGVEACVTQDLLPVALARPAVHLLGEPVEAGLGQAEHLAHVANGRTRAVADRHRHHGSVRAAVLVVDVLDDLLAALVLDVGRSDSRGGQSPAATESGGPSRRRSGLVLLEQAEKVTATITASVEVFMGASDGVGRELVQALRGRQQRTESCSSD